MSNNLLQPTGGLSASLIEELKQTARALTDDLHDLQQALHKRPEVAWQETFAHDSCTQYLETADFKVTRHAYGLKTAWEATFEVGNDGPVIGFNSEMDALPGIGHACGHNLICIAGIAAAICTARVLRKHGVPCKVVLLGTPAEESGGGKAYMLERGAYDGMEACLMTHTGTKGSGATIPTLSCNASFSVKYKGASAHAGAMPERGINALDAAVAAYTNISLLRQQTKAGVRIYHTIQGSERWTANLIPSESTFVVGIRTPSAKDTYDLIPHVLDCLKAAALATGCKHEIRREEMYMDMLQAGGLAEYLREVGAATWGDEYKVEDDTTSASSDFGNVSYHLPALHPMFRLPEAEDSDFPHSDTFASSTSSHSATEAAIKSAVTIAALGLRMIIDRDWAKKVRDDWEAGMSQAGSRDIASKMEGLVGSYPLAEDIQEIIGRYPK